VFEAIQQHIAEHGYAPSVRELAQIVGVNLSTTHVHLRNLERDGKISREPGLPRTITLGSREEAA
jgi:repressor LexA